MEHKLAEPDHMVDRAKVRILEADAVPAPQFPGAELLLRFLSPTFLRYTAVGLASRTGQTLILFLAIDYMGIETIAASLIAGALVHLLAFLVHMRWTFAKR